MKTIMNRVYCGLLCGTMILLPTAGAHAQSAAPNQVLELDGKGSYVQLPPDIFNDLTEATVEGWVKWDAVGSWTRVFGYGDAWKSLMIGNRADAPDLTFQMYPDNHTIVIRDAFRPHQWLHIAAVSGPRGMQLFLNGALVGTNSFTGSFKSAGSGKSHFLGRSEWGEDSGNDTLSGQMDEVRVWKVARTAEQIRESLFQKLTGKEPGLAGYWNFDDGGANGVVKDLSPGGHDGKLMGKARTVAGRPPTAEEWKQQRAAIGGIVKDETGHTAPGTAIVLKVAGSQIAQTTTDAAGHYSLSIDPNLAVDLLARNGKRTARVGAIKLQPMEARTLDVTFGASTGSLALDLDGNFSSVEFPPDIINNLTEATVELWVKRNPASRNDRFFQFGGFMHDVGIEAASSGTIRFFLQDAKEGTQDLTQPSVLNDKPSWKHVAAISGPQGMKLVVNGNLVASSEARGSFAAVKAIGGFSLGREVDGRTFAGQIDEVRIWNHARTLEQIRANLFTTLTGKEPGLAGYWNFDDGTAKDLTPGQHEGELMGDVVFSPATREYQVVAGKVVGSDQKPVAEAEVRALSGGQPIATSKTDANGNYFCVVTEPVGGASDIQAVKEELTAWRFALNLQPNGRSEANLQLSDALKISGTVRTLDDQEPLEGVVVQALATAPGAATNFAALSISTDKTGGFRFLHLKPGEYRLQCVSESGLVEPVNGSLVKVRAEGTPASVRFLIAPSQPGAWRHFTRFDGLAPGGAGALLFDRQGSLWIGSRDGLTRFDGQNWGVFTTRDGLSGNDIGAMILDKEGRLLVRSGHGINRFHGNRFEPYPLPKHVAGKIGNNRGFLLDRDGVLWVGTYGEGVFYCKDGVWEQQKMPHGKENEVWQIAEDKGGTIWMGTSLGITRYKEGVWKFCDDEDGIGHPNNIAPGLAPGMGPRGGDGVGEVWGLLVDSHDNVWAGTWKGLSRYDGHSWKLFTTADGLPAGGIEWLYEDHDGVIWAAGSIWGSTPGGGLCRFDGNRWTNVRPGQTGPITEDAAGNLWVSRDGGVSRYDRKHWQVVDTKRGLPSGNVVSLVKDPQGRLLIGFGPSGSSYAIGKANNEQLSRRNLATLGIIRYDAGHFESIDVPTNAITVNAIFSDSKSNLWLSGNTAMWKSTTWRLADGQWHDLRHGGISCFAEDMAGRIWMSEEWFVKRLEGESLVQMRWPGAASMAPDRQGRMWLAINKDRGGLHCFDGEKNDGTEPWTVFTATNGLPQNFTTCVHVDRKDRVWVGTRGGIARYDGSNWKVWDRFDGLAANWIKDIKEDRDGLIWVAHGDSVSFFDGTVWSSLDSRDGMTIACDKLLPESDGSMWLGGSGGLLRYSRQRGVPAAPTLLLTGEKLEQSGSALQPPPVTQGTRLTFEFAARDFLTEPAKLQFRYLITEGALSADSLTNNTKWTAPTLQRRLEWSTNHPGTYSMAVQFIDRDLNYSKPALATLTIVPLWYRDARIMAPSGGALLGLVGWSGLLTFRYGRKRRETERLREKMLVQEQRAREALEAKATQLAAAKEAAESAKVAAESANHAKSLFLANMSHEIRTPMNAILGYSQILRRDGELPPKYRPPIETIEKSGDHLLAMINDILDLSKIEAGRMDLQETDFDLTSLILGLKAMFKMRCEEKDLKLEVEGLGDSPCPVHADEGKLRQVLINLMGNAVKFTERGGVTLRVKNLRPEMGDPKTVKADVNSGQQQIAIGNGSPQNIFRFEIIDTGQGIPAESQAALFQPFHQSAEGMKKGGTGLGLAISKRQVELMGGTIALESQVGRGSRFVIALPLASARSKVTARVDGNETREILGLAEGCRVKVLVVDDVRQNRDVLSQLLLGIGCDVEVAEGGTAALEKLRLAIPDIVFMDIRMPDMDGPEVLRNVFTEFGRGRTKLVALSASVLAHEQQSYLKAGFDAFIGKPFRFEEICRCMQRLLPINFRYAEERVSSATELEAVNPAEISLSRALQDQLVAAAERYSVTKLEQGFEALAATGEVERRAANYLRSLAQRGDFDAVGEFLKSAGHD